MKKLKKIPEPWVFSIEKIETIKRFLLHTYPPKSERTHLSIHFRRRNKKKIGDLDTKKSPIEKRNRQVEIVM